MSDYCCKPDSGQCCGPGSWCCAHAGQHEHEEPMTTEPTDLRERIEASARDVMRRSALIADVDLPAYVADAVLPIVQGAQAEALRDAATEYRRGYAVSRPPVVVERFLKHRADEIERSTDDES